MPEAGRSLPADWLRPDWAAPACVQAVCTTRAGGVSAPPFDSFNLGDHVGDLASHVAANRSRLQAALGVRPVFLSQVHGAQVLHIDAATPDGVTADACVCSVPGVACTVMVADCLPVLLASAQGDRVAGAHAGWRGLAGQGGFGVLENVVKQFCAPGHTHKALPATEVVAWLGPCIGPQAFAVGDEVREAFVTQTPQAASCFVAEGAGRWRADLAQLARQRLHALGLTRIDGNDSSASWCTASQESRFFSHRRDRVSGRMAACVWLARN